MRCRAECRMYGICIPKRTARRKSAFMESIKGFDAITACKAMDERLSALVARHPDGQVRQVEFGQARDNCAYHAGWLSDKTVD